MRRALHAITATTLGPMLALALGCIGYAAPAHADVRIVACASIDFRDAYCPADTRGGVRLAQQVSRAPCEEGVTWGYDRRGIWVTQGCEGEFALDVGARSGYGRDRYGRRIEERHPGDPAGRGIDRGGDRREIYDGRNRQRRHALDRGGVTVVCESLDFRYRHCAVPVRDHIDLTEQLSKSECRHRVTWGFDARGVWVDRGCAAAFTVY